MDCSTFWMDGVFFWKIKMEDRVGMLSII